MRAMCWAARCASQPYVGSRHPLFRMALLRLLAVLGDLVSGPRCRPELVGPPSSISRMLSGSVEQVQRQDSRQ